MIESIEFVMKHDVYLSLGSNINRNHNIKSCLKSLQRTFGKLSCSSVYESEPVGFNGDCFYNLNVKITTSLSLKQLSTQLKIIEDENGRVRGGERFSSRTLDIDILTYDDLCGVYEGIELPRAELFHNAFVLLPMVDLASDRTEPKTKLSYAELWSERKSAILKNQKLWRVDFDWPQGIETTSAALL